MKVLVADDQTVVREGLATLLSTLSDVEVVGAAANGKEAVALAESTSADVVLMDLRMPEMDGVEATRLIRQCCPSAQVVVLTTFADDESIVGALRAGAIGYLTKDAGRADIYRAIQAAMAGQAMLDPDVQARLVQAASVPAETVASGPAPDGLTTRECEVLGLVAAGLTNGEIAERLFLGEATVKTHINHIFTKTGCRDRAQAVTYAHRHGLAN